MCCRCSPSTIANDSVTTASKRQALPALCCVWRVLWLANMMHSLLAWPVLGFGVLLRSNVLSCTILVQLPLRGRCFGSCNSGCFELHRCSFTTVFLVFGSQVKAHPYFAKMDWERLLKKHITPPFRPDVSSFNAIFSRQAFCVPCLRNGFLHGCIAISW